MKETVVLYSGGTDSTCAAAMTAENFDRVHLLTCRRFGVFSTGHIGYNVARLKAKFGAEKFVHRTVNIDKLFKHVSYSGYFSSLAGHGFFLLTTCGFCKLAMHIRCVIYCLDHGIRHVCDGANRNSDYSPDQIREFVDELKKFYAGHGIEYTTPVYEMAHPGDIGWFDKLGVNTLAEGIKDEKDSAVTTGDVLYRMGIFRQRNVKGTAEDRRMQARCFQLVLSNIFAHWLYIPGHGLEEYKRRCVDLYKKKIAHYDGCIKEYTLKRDKSRIFRLLSPIE
jgi:hypothetical protein